MKFYKKNSLSILGGVVCLAFVLFVARMDWSVSGSFMNYSNCATPADNEASLAQVIQGSATSGKLFKGEKVHTFDKTHIKFDAYEAKINKKGKEAYQSIDNIPSCHKWSVVTTIFEPSDAVKHQAEQKSWCLVVVGDFKGPLSYIIPNHPSTPITTPSSDAVAASVNNNDRRMTRRRHMTSTNATIKTTTSINSTDEVQSNLTPPTTTVKDISSSKATTKDVFIFLEKHHQMDLSTKFPFINKLPWNHFGRKNVGYLYAIMHGAQQIWDFDDDNIYIQKEMIDIEKEMNDQGFVQVLKINNYNSSVFNPYPIMAAPHLPSWPRGIPLTAIKPTNSPFAVQQYKLALTSTLISKSEIGIIQSLANHDPDMDAIYRLIQPIPFSFYYPTNQQQRNGFTSTGITTTMKMNQMKSTTAAAATTLADLMMTPHTPNTKEKQHKQQQQSSRAQEGKEVDVMMKKKDDDKGNEKAAAAVSADTHTQRRRLNNSPATTAATTIAISSHENSNMNHYEDTNDDVMMAMNSIERKLQQKDSYTSNLNGQVLKHCIIVPSTAYSPYNAQATLHMYNALWSLYLPVTVHGRVSDIWRGYIFQRLAKDINIKLLFAPPLVRQDRNVHNYLADFNSEADLYLKSGRLLQQLNEWTFASRTLPGRIEEMYIYMYEHDYINKLDVELIQLWIQALHDVHYTFPPLSATALTNATTVVV